MLAFEFRRQRIVLTSAEVEVEAQVSSTIQTTNIAVFISKAAIVPTEVPAPAHSVNWYVSSAGVKAAANTPIFPYDGAEITITVPAPGYTQAEAISSAVVPVVGNAIEARFVYTVDAAVSRFIPPAPTRWSHQYGFQHQAGVEVAIPATLGLTQAVQVVCSSTSSSVVSGAVTAPE